MKKETAQKKMLHSEIIVVVIKIMARGSYSHSNPWLPFAGDFLFVR